MLTSDFNYKLPKECIAHEPIEPRDHSKLMVVNREARTHEHKQFFDIVDYLQSGDVLVLNNSKVFKARLFGTLVSPTGRILRDRPPVEIFLVRPTENGLWKALGYKGKRIKPGMKIIFCEHAGDSIDSPEFWCDVVLKEPDDAAFLLEFPDTPEVVRQKANKFGQIPLPGYIENDQVDLDMYQTMFASDEKEGSVAAPTAAFHFTKELLERIRAKGIIVAEVTLHVGLGTFVPVKTDDIRDHQMHSEWVEISAEAAAQINTAKQEGRRVIAVGTTAVRTLEGVAGFHKSATVAAYTGDVDIFITPGFEFKIVDAMITNFHLPQTTLLMLVCAFAGNTDFMLSLYKEAVLEKYRFYSFGDAMLII
jgi:S-adenosylmethionine:tRNA ribosyltransferase-isomerase